MQTVEIFSDRTSKGEAKVHHEVSGHGEAAGQDTQFARVLRLFFIQVSFNIFSLIYISIFYFTTFITTLKTLLTSASHLGNNTVCAILFSIWLTYKDAP